VNNKEKLEDIIENVLLLDISDAIDEIFEKIATSKNRSSEDEEEIKEYRELKTEFEELLKDLKADKVESEEIDELIEEFEQMIFSDDME